MTLPPRKLVLYAAILIVPFLGAMIMHLPRMVGWRFFLLCFALGAVGGVAANIGLQKLKSRWTQLPSRMKAVVVRAVVIAYITIAISTGSDVFETVLVVVLGLGLLGVYLLFSRIFDRLWARLTSR